MIVECLADGGVSFSVTSLAMREECAAFEAVERADVGSRVAMARKPRCAGRQQLSAGRVRPPNTSKNVRISRLASPLTDTRYFRSINYTMYKLVRAL